MLPCCVDTAVEGVGRGSTAARAMLWRYRSRTLLLMLVRPPSFEILKCLQALAARIYVQQLLALSSGQKTKPHPLSHIPSSPCPRFA